MGFVVFFHTLPFQLFQDQTHLSESSFGKSKDLLFSLNFTILIFFQNRTHLSESSLGKAREMFLKSNSFEWVKHWLSHGKCFQKSKFRKEAEPWSNQGIGLPIIRFCWHRTKWASLIFAMFLIFKHAQKWATINTSFCLRFNFLGLLSLWVHHSFHFV